MQAILSVTRVYLTLRRSQKNQLSQWLPGNPSPTELSIMSRLAVSLIFSAAQQVGSLQLTTSTDENTVAQRLRLHMMTDKGLNHDGAVCLDGSDAGFYYAPARGNLHTKDWLIMIQGGAWCFQEKDCVERAHSPLGSSHFGHRETWSERALNGIMSDDCNANPDFCNFNKVLVPYCDGTSFTGNREEPVTSETAEGKPFTLYFRGARVRNAVFDTLFTMGLDNAEKVLLSGYSAGGLSTILHTDYVHERLQASAPNLRKFRAVPLSGFFLNHQSIVSNSTVFGDELNNMVMVANSSGALDSECLAEHRDNEWQCILAPTAYKYVNAPTFIMNSGLDSWQTSFILTSKLPNAWPHTPKHPYIHCCDGWVQCFTSKGFSSCSSEQVSKLMTYQNDFEQELALARKTKGDGAFVHSCSLHVEALDPEWNSLKVNGKSMQEALSRWWHSHEGAPTQQYTTLDCHLNGAAPYQCNPTCPGRD